MILFRRRSPESPWEEVPNACFELQDAGFEYRYFFSAAPTLPVQQDDEALQVLRLALDALVESVAQVQHDYDTDWRHNIPTRASQLQRSLDALNAHKAAIERVRAILTKRGAA